MRIFIEYAPAGGNEAAGKISGHVRTKVTVYLRTIRSGDNRIVISVRGIAQNWTVQNFGCSIERESNYSQRSNNSC